MLVACDVGELCSYAELSDCTSSAAFGTWTVSAETRTIRARSGFSVAIPCTPPPANPAPRVVWQKNDVDIPARDPLNGGDDERIQVLPSGHLVIHELEASDYGGALYRCSVRNVNTHSTSDSPQMFTLINGMYVLSAMCNPVLVDAYIV